MIIAITGLKRHGKDTVANRLVHCHGFTSMKFADPIKKVLCEIFGWDMRVFEDDSRKEAPDPYWGVSPRIAAQTLGTEWGQFTLSEKSPLFAEKTGRLLWTNSVLREVEKLWSKYPGKRVVISDLRFLHEAHALRAFGDLHRVPIKIWRINNPRLGGNTDPHPSEKEILQVREDLLVQNDGTVDDLWQKIDRIVGGL